MSSPQSTTFPNIDRRSSLRTRVPKIPNVEEPSNLARKCLRPLLRQSTAATGTVALSSINSMAIASASSGAARTYRSIYPKLDTGILPEEPSNHMATTGSSSSSSLPTKKTRLCQKPQPPIINKQSFSKLSSSNLQNSTIANFTAKSAKFHHKQSATSLIMPSILPPLTQNTSYNPNAQNEDKMQATNSKMVPERLVGSFENRKKHSRDEFEDLEEKNFMISCGLDNQVDDYAAFYFTKVDFEAVLEFVPYFKKFLNTYSNSIFIRGYTVSSFKVIIQWLTTGKIMPLEVHKSGRAEGLSNYPFVLTYLMANEFNLPNMCDELMDLAMKELWGKDDQLGILPDIREMYTVYSQTQSGNPLRKLYIAIFDWLLTSDECNLDSGKSKISSPELWNLLSSSGHAGIDYIDYCRSQITDRGTYTHPLDPRKWNLCELHQHFPRHDCPVWIKRQNAAQEED